MEDLRQRRHRARVLPPGGADRPHPRRPRGLHVSVPADAEVLGAHDRARRRHRTAERDQPDRHRDRHHPVHPARQQIQGLQPAGLRRHGFGVRPLPDGPDVAGLCRSHGHHSPGARRTARSRWAASPQHDDRPRRLLVGVQWLRDRQRPLRDGHPVHGDRDGRRGALVAETQRVHRGDRAHRAGRHLPRAFPDSLVSRQDPGERVFRAHAHPLVAGDSLGQWD